MGHDDSSFLFGSGKDSSSQPCAIKRLHLATRGIGDKSLLARVLNEYRCTRRYITEGSKISVPLNIFIDVYSNSATPREALKLKDVVVTGNRGTDRFTEAANLGDETHETNLYRKEYTDASDHSGDTTTNDGQTFASVDSSPFVSWDISQSTGSKGGDECQIHTHASLDFLKSSSSFGIHSSSFDLAHPFSNSLPLGLNEDAIEYIVVKCDPQRGYIDESTVFYTDENLPILRRVDLLWDIDDESLLDRYITHFLGPDYVGTLKRDRGVRHTRLYGPYSIGYKAVSESSQSGRVRKNVFINLQHSKREEVTHGRIQENDIDAITDLLLKSIFKSVLSEALSSEFHVFYTGQTLYLRDLKLFVHAIAPHRRPGIIMPETEVRIGIDTFGECTAVSVAPLRDTLPTTYQYNLLKDCVEPYFRGSRSRMFHVDDVFTFGGVQFRVTGLEGKAEKIQLFSFDLPPLFSRQVMRGRVGPTTEIYVKDPVDPQITDMLSKEQLRHLRRCAPNQREMLIFKFASQLDPDAMGRICGVDHNYANRLGIDSTLLSSDSARLRDLGTLHGSIDHYNISDDSNDFCSQDRDFDDEMCTVCCDNINYDKHDDIFAYKCGHLFHRHCAKEWIRMCGMSCPNCRHLQFDLISTAPGVVTGEMHNLSDDADTVVSHYLSREKSLETLSVNSDADHLLWLNSQEFG